MWDKVLQSADQATIARQWTAVLDAWVELEGTDWRYLIDEANRSALIEISSSCAQILRKGFSPSAAALQAICDFHIDGMFKFAGRVNSIAQFLGTSPSALSTAEPLSGDHPDKLRDFPAAKFILGPLAKKQIKSPKGTLIGIGSVVADPRSGWDDYYSTGDLYQFQICEAPVEEYVTTLDYVRTLLNSLNELKKLKFATTALSNVLAEVEAAISRRLPTGAPVKSVSEQGIATPAPDPFLAPAPASAQPQDARTVLGRLARQSRDIFLRPYLEAARNVFALEGTSLRAALSDIALLPVALETVGPLLACNVFESEPSNEESIRIDGEPTLDATLAELEKRRSHRITQIFLRRAVEMAGHDDVARLKLIAEDRDRWRRIVEPQITTPKLLHEKLRAMISQWSSVDPACPALPYIDSALLELERKHPVTREELASAGNLAVSKVAGSRHQNGDVPQLRSAWGFLQELEVLAVLAERATGNPLPSGYLRKALDAVKRTETQ